eukprot:jgi/Botrbrau1/17505/Bobra.0054s0081.1
MATSDTYSVWEIIRQPEYVKVLSATIPVLGLGIMGSALFPLPESFISTGVIANTCVMIVVAAGTLYTAELLLHQAYMTGQSDLETLCLVVGGKWWKKFTEISILVLLIGSIVGAVVMVAEICNSAARHFAGDADIASWISFRDGSVFMIIACLAVFPICMVELMTQLEYASYVGFVFVIMLVATIGGPSQIRAGLLPLQTCTPAREATGSCASAYRPGLTAHSARAWRKWILQLEWQFLHP